MRILAFTFFVLTLAWGAEGGWPTPPRGTGFHQSAIEARGVPNLFCGLCRKGSGFDLRP
jgi:hypothetical protein